MAFKQDPNKKAAFVNAEQITKEQPDGTESKYIRSKTFDLDDIKSKLGTPYAQIKVYKKKKGTDIKPEDRLIVFESSDKKWMPRSAPRGEGAGYGNPRSPQNEDDGVI